MSWPDYTIWLNTPPPSICSWPPLIRPGDWRERQCHRLLRVARPYGAKALDGITRPDLYQASEVHVLARYTELRLRAARDSARIIRSTDTTADEKAEAWNHLFELGRKIGIGLGPPRSILADTRPGDLDRIQQFDAPEMVDAMVGELLSHRLDNLELLFPLDGLRVNVEIQRERHYKTALSALHSADTIEKPLPESEEPITRWEPGVVVAVDIELVLAQLRRRGLPADAAALIFGRFQHGGSDVDVARALGWSKCRLEAAQASLKPERWGKSVQKYFNAGRYCPPPAHPRRRSVLSRQVAQAMRRTDTLSWQQRAAHARTGRFGCHRVIFLSANASASAPLK